MEKNVLIVDDVADIRDMLTVALSAEGFLVKTTDSLYGALHILQQESCIDCMLLDYNLPGMPMEDFLKQIRDVAPKIGIVLISAVERVAGKAERLGIATYLGKPFDFDQLREAMEQCLRLQQEK